MGAEEAFVAGQEVTVPVADAVCGTRYGARSDERGTSGLAAGIERSPLQDDYRLRTGVREGGSGSVVTEASVAVSG